MHVVHWSKINDSDISVHNYCHLIFDKKSYDTLVKERERRRKEGRKEGIKKAFLTNDAGKIGCLHTEE